MGGDYSRVAADLCRAMSAIVPIESALPPKADIPRPTLDFRLDPERTFRIRLANRHEPKTRIKRTSCPYAGPPAQAADVAEQDYRVVDDQARVRSHILTIGNNTYAKVHIAIRLRINQSLIDKL